MRRVALAAVLACAACGGSDSSTLVVGEGPTPFTAIEAHSTRDPAFFAIVVGTTDGSVPSSSYAGCSVSVDLSTVPFACSLPPPQAPRPTPAVGIRVANGALVPIRPGVYQVGSPIADDPTPFASVVASTLNPDCAECWMGRYSASGTVTLAEVGPTGISGTVDATLDDGTRVTGSFAAWPCDPSIEERSPPAPCLQ